MSDIVELYSNGNVIITNKYIDLKGRFGRWTRYGPIVGDFSRQRRVRIWPMPVTSAFFAFYLEFGYGKYPDLDIVPRALIGLVVGALIGWLIAPRLWVVRFRTRREVAPRMGEENWHYLAWSRNKKDIEKIAWAVLFCGGQGTALPPEIGAAPKRRIDFDPDRDVG